MNDRRRAFPHLNHLCGAYFHQDWVLEAPDTAGVITTFVRESPPERLRATVAELRALLDSEDPPDLDRLLDDLSCEYLPAADGLTARTWLEQVVERLNQSIRTRD